MARKKCTFKWQDKSLRLNGKTKVYVKMARQNYSVRLNGKAKVFVSMTRQKFTFKWQD